MASRWSRLEKVYANIERDPHFAGLRTVHTRLVPGDGPTTAETSRILLVGEAPGATENGQGKPFVGASGRMLGQLLELANLTREEVFITNVLKYRPLGNRTPTPGEVEHARPWLRREHNILEPLLTVAIGRTAQTALNQHSPVHGMIVPFGQSEVFVTSVYHPAFGLRNAKAREWIEAEWSLLGRQIKEVLPELTE